MNQVAHLPARAGVPDSDGHASLNRGLLFGASAYGIWGLLPLYWRLLEGAYAVEVLAHRFVWALGIIALLLWVRPRVELVARAEAAACCAAVSRRGRGGHRGQLVLLHLGRQPRAGGGDVARVLHQSAGHGRGRGGAVSRAAAAAAETRARPGRGGGGLADVRLRPRAVGGGRVGAQLRDVRHVEEEGGDGGGRKPRRRGDGHPAGRAGLSGVAGVDGPGGVRARRLVDDGAPDRRRLRPRRFRCCSSPGRPRGSR